MTDQRVLYAYLTILTGNRAGTNFPLDPARENVIGRGTDCHISIPDPISSREHAAIARHDDVWTIRDLEEPQRHERQRSEDRRSAAGRREHAADRRHGV